MTTSDYFSGFLPILNSRRAQLLDHKRLATQLCSLERRPSRIGAKDSISHPFGGHNDCAAAGAGLMVGLVGTRDYRLKHFHVPVVASRPCGDFGEPFVSGADGAYDNVSMPPGGYPLGANVGIDAQLGWTPGKRH
jgi:hypothetical protein